MQMETKLIYSVFSGTYYNVLKKDLSLLNIGQIPMLKKPPTNCKKCYGRGYNGRDNKTFAYNVCNCIRKNVDRDVLKSLIPPDINIE